MTLETRVVTEAELADWIRAVSNGFLRATVVTDAQVASRREGLDLSRTYGVFDGGRCVATYRSFGQKLTVPGGARVAASAVSSVTVAPTHRRRGLLSGLITDDLAAAKERGEVVSTLIAAEYPIYGRYGYGCATSTTEWSLDLPRTGLGRRWSRPADGGRIDLVDGAEVRKVGPELHERCAAHQHGVVSRDDYWWRGSTGALDEPVFPWVEPFYAVYRAANGEVEGLLTYRTDDVWSDSKQPQCAANVGDLVAVTPAAERALWHYLASVDWITTVRSGFRAPDDLLPRLLPDPRAAKVIKQADWLWVRILDVVRALEARTYDVSATLVLELRDRLGLAGGRYRLEVSPEGARCAPTAEAADLTMDIGVLGSLYLGDENPVRLKALGELEEHRAGAAAEADRVFRTARKPWCPDVF
ncbi:GNAT family N-acetyltransferase [Streptomyces sp. NPDC057638]|uniref:GNAT family N-acetyltransferase n=1 Tax=Streptomyces sp. NPDC057638 TaxID=3346190 RepID=UPI003673E89E